MTAPGQEPDEVMTGKPGGKGPDEPDLGAIGDSHMPADVRESVRQEAAEGGPDTSEATQEEAEAPEDEVGDSDT